MDNVTHGLVGGSIGMVVSQTIYGTFEPTLFAIGVFAAEIPDFDIFGSIKNSAKRMKYHRGMTHSFVCIPWIALLLSLPFAIFSSLSFLGIYLSGLGALFSHTFLDILNCYGTKMLSPFSHRRYAYDLLPIFDIWIFLLFSLGIILAILWHSSALCAAFLAFGGYLLLRFLLKYCAKAIIKKNIKAEKVYPLPRNHPFLWDCIALKEGYYYLGNVHIIKEKVYLQEIMQLPQIDTAQYELSDEVTIFLKFARFPYCYEKKERGETVLYWTDLRYRLQRYKGKIDWK